MTLRITDDDYTFPDDIVTESLGILAVKRAGKSNAAVVIAEEMYDREIPWVAIDPKGDWWGVRAAGDGESPGLSVLVFGGNHGDVPLEPGAGQLVADLVVDQRLTCVLDVSEMTKADQRRFLTAFAERLYRRNSAPLHLFCEEADEYIPQMVRGENAKLVGAFETLVKRGGFKGIGITLITQRSASLNKDVLTQIGTLIVLRTTSPQDRKAVGEWIKYHAEAESTLAELAGLDNGEAFVYSPSFLQQLARIRFRRRRTFDSGATPKIGQAIRPPAKLADVDIDAIIDAMADTIQRTGADDPQMLRAEIKELRRQITDLETRRPVERIEVPVLDFSARSTINERVNDYLKAADQLAGVWLGLKKTLERWEEQGSPTLVPGEMAIPVAQLTKAPLTVLRQASKPATVGPKAAPSVTYDQGVPLAKAERAILSVLKQYRSRTKIQTAILAGYTHNGGGFNNSLGALRTKGLIIGSNELEITEAGDDAVGTVDPLLSGHELAEFWYAKLGKAERLILAYLIGELPCAVAKDDLATATGYTASGGGFNNALGKLRTLELISGRGNEPLLASDVFA